MNSSAVLIGGGGHARVVLDTLLGMGRLCRGVIAQASPDLLDIEYLGGDEAALRHFPNGAQAAMGVGGTPRQGASGTALRRRIYEQYREAGFTFPALVGRGVILAPDVEIEDGGQIIAGAIIQPNVRIGQNVLVNTGACVDHDTVIQAHAMVGPRAVLCGGVIVEEGAYIGAGAVVLQGIRIGADSVVAAGAVATADLPTGGYVSRR
ncbi:MAG: NeuD/PglB/VioB family sugar acetyltransferase [Brevundimonas sp.]